MTTGSNVRIALLGVAASVVLAATPALAKDVCLSDGSVTYLVFSKAKAPKKPGATTTVQAGYMNVGTGSVLPCSGAIVQRQNGTLKVGMTCYATPFLSNSFQMSWNAVDASLAGTATVDNDGDYLIDDFTLTWTAVDCSTVTVP